MCGVWHQHLPESPTHPVSCRAYRGCQGDPPPRCSVLAKPSGASALSYNDPTDSRAQYRYKPDTCVKAESIYAWSSECARPTHLGSTCSGEALCAPTGAHTAALATCTAWGWVATDGCKPAACAAPPTSQLAVFVGCKAPGLLGQQCQGTCEAPSVGAPVATCTSGGWAISGALCGEFKSTCLARPAPCSPTFNTHSSLCMPRVEQYVLGKEVRPGRNGVGFK